MNIKDIIEVVLLFVLFVFVGISLYFKYNTKLNSKVNDLIDQAEVTYKGVTNAGEDKNNWVIDKLYGLIPAPFKIIISKDMISKIVNNTFDSMESYAIKQVDKIVNTQILDDEDEDARGGSGDDVEDVDGEIQG